MRAYKFLQTGRMGLFSGVRWPEPGEWLDSEGDVAECVAGIHAVRAAELLRWLDDELWLVELDGEVVDAGDTLVAERGMLVERVDAWDERAASDFAAACVRRGCAHAVAALQRAGHPSGDALDGLEPDSFLAQAVPLAADLPEELRTPVGFAADAVVLARGRRPEEYAQLEAPAGPPRPAAVAANLAFVVAHAAGVVHPGGYEAGVAEERAWQLAWLHDRLGLAPGM